MAKIKFFTDTDYSCQSFPEPMSLCSCEASATTPSPSTDANAHAHPVSDAPHTPWSWCSQNWDSSMSLDTAPDSAEQCTSPSQCPHIHSQVKILPYKSQSIKSERGGYFFKCEDTNARLQGT